MYTFNRLFASVILLYRVSSFRSAALLKMPAKRRRSALSILSKWTSYGDKTEGEEDDEDDEEEEEAGEGGQGEDEFQPSEGSENEMETEMLDYT